MTDRPQTGSQRLARRQGIAAANAGTPIEDCPFKAGTPREHFWKIGHRQASGDYAPARVPDPPKPVTIDGVWYPSRNAAERELGWTVVREILRNAA